MGAARRYCHLSLQDHRENRRSQKACGKERKEMIKRVPFFCLFSQVISSCSPLQFVSPLFGRFAWRHAHMQDEKYSYALLPTPIDEKRAATKFCNLCALSLPV
jgi:hypothetical protein